MYLNKPSTEESSPKKKSKGLKDYFDYRNNQINQIGLILFASFVIATSLHSFLDHRFTEERWKQNPMQRYEMLDDILDKDLFIDDTKKEVIHQLGYPSILNSSTTNQFNYYVGKGEGLSNDQSVMLTLIFENNRVTKVLLLPITK